MAIRYIVISDCDIKMSLGEKIRYLREMEGALRGLGRALTQQEVSREIEKKLRKKISQSYISQIESERGGSGRLLLGFDIFRIELSRV